MVNLQVQHQRTRQREVSITHIVAKSTNNVIGINNQLPWHLPKDLKYFKEVTMGKAMLMGRKTFNSLPNVLKGRTHLVLTREHSVKKDNVFFFDDIEKALKFSNDIYVIGGGEIFAQTMHLATDLLVTEVHTEIKGDTFYPNIDLGKWQLASSEFHTKDDKHPYDFTFKHYVTQLV
jgi:dihydrofolate reductase